MHEDKHYIECCGDDISILWNTRDGYRASFHSGVYEVPKELLIFMEQVGAIKPLGTIQTTNRKDD